MYLAKNKLDRKLANATQNVEALHQLASSYFIDRDGTMRKLHEIQISTNAIKVSTHDNDDTVKRKVKISHFLPRSPRQQVGLTRGSQLFPAKGAFRRLSSCPEAVVVMLDAQ